MPNSQSCDDNPVGDGTSPSSEWQLLMIPGEAGMYSKSDSKKYYTRALQYKVWSEGFLYKVAPPELKNSPIMYFVIHNSVVLSKILKIVVP